MDVDTALNHLGSLKLNPKLQGDILRTASNMNMLLGSADDVAEAMIKLNAQGTHTASAFAGLGPMLTGFFTSPVGMIAAATAATVGILALIDHFTVTRDKALASAQEASQNFKNTQEELSSLDSQYQANQKRITELNALKSNGTISASGRAELEMLEKENIALETQINSKNTLRDMEQQKANQTGKKYLEKKETGLATLYNDKGRRHYKNPETPDIYTESVTDAEAIQLADTKINEIRSAFTDWLNEQLPELKQRLADLYNRKFNCYVRPDYDGSLQSFPFLDLKGLDIPDLYDSQKNAVWMLKMNGGGIIDHEVGTGKTLIMCIAAFEMKRLGMANKPMIIGLKSNVHDIADTFKKAYPNAKVLYPGKEDFTPEKRVGIFHDIKNNNWDCIILTHDQFGKIPQSPEIQQEIYTQEINNIEENLAVFEQQGNEVTGWIKNGLEKRKENLEAKLEKLEQDIKDRTDDVTDFRQMGIDHLFVDESHYQNF